MEKMTEIFDRNELTVVIKGEWQGEAVLHPDHDKTTFKLPQGRLKEVKYKDPVKKDIKTIHVIQPDQQGKYYFIVWERYEDSCSSWNSYTTANFGSYGGCKIIASSITGDGDQVTLIELEATAAFQIHYDLTCRDHGEYDINYLCINGEVKSCSTTELLELGFIKELEA